MQSRSDMMNKAIRVKVIIGKIDEKNAQLISLDARFNNDRLAPVAKHRTVCMRWDRPNGGFAVHLVECPTARRARGSFHLAVKNLEQRERAVA